MKLSAQGMKKLEEPATCKPSSAQLFNTSVVKFQFQFRWFKPQRYRTGTTYRLHATTTTLEWYHLRTASQVCTRNLETRTADPLWALEYCKTQWFRAAPAISLHSLQILSGSWNASETEVKMLRPHFGFTHCRSFLGAGMLIKLKSKCSARTLVSFRAYPLWELECW